MSLTRLKYWTTWSTARGYSLSEEEELALVDDLRDRRPETPVRQGLTERQLMSVLMTLLRDGAEIDDITAAGATLDYRALALAYDRLDDELQQATQAWQAIVDAPESFEEQHEAAARVLPLAISNLRTLPGQDRPAAVTRAAHAVTSIGREAATLERLMHDTEDPDRKHDLHYSLARAESCVWEDGLFLPTRVGQLTPTRLNFLLGEATDA